MGNWEGIGGRHSLWFRRKQFPRFLRDNREAVEAANREMLALLSIVITCLSGVLTLVGLVGRWAYITPFYGALFAVSLCTLFFSRYYLHKMPRNFSVLPAMYLYGLCLFGYAFCLAFFITPKGTTNTMIALLILVPLLILDVPIHMIALLGAVDIAFILCSLVFLPPQDAENAIVNCLAFSALSLVSGRYICGIKLRSIDIERQLSINSYCDVLTGLGNRRKLFERIAALEKPDAPERLTGAVMLDIDRFKDYNDHYGHQQGDECLRILGRVLEETGRECGLEFFRYGGEEFLALYTGTERKALFAGAETLREAVFNAAIPFATYGAGRVTVSVGYAASEEDAGYETLIRQADSALYEAKAQGRNCTVGFRHGLTIGELPGEERFRTEPRNPAAEPVRG